MSQWVLDDAPVLPRRGGNGLLIGFVLGSLALHGGALAVLSAKPVDRPVAQRPVEMVMVEVQRPPPPPEVKPEEPKSEPPPPPKRVPRPPPVKVAVAEKPPPPPPMQAPPPPNDAPPPAPNAKPAPLVVGLSLSSTTSAGGFAAPVGNTLYGKADGKARAPQDVRAYSAPRYTPIYQVDTEPRLLSEVKISYPDEARRAGVEGTVTLSITIDPEGRVLSARVLSGPGHGLEEAAREAILRFRFKPATKQGEPVSTEMKYAYTFLLD
ncbi:TonB family protein [Myxococcaceae bacterium GXIMD 01537]